MTFIIPMVLAKGHMKSYSVKPFCCKKSWSDVVSSTTTVSKNLRAHDPRDQETSSSVGQGTSLMILATSKVHFWSSDKESLPTNLSLAPRVCEQIGTCHHYHFHHCQDKSVALWTLTVAEGLDNLLQVILLLQDLFHLLLEHAFLRSIFTGSFQTRKPL